MCVARRTINQAEGANVQPYHTFTREVAFLKLPVSSRPSSPPRPGEPHNGLRELTADEKESQHQFIGTTIFQSFLFVLGGHAVVFVLLR